MTNVTLHDKTFETFIGRERIQTAILELAVQLQKDYEGKKPIFIGVLNGSFLFVADLVREFDGDCEVTFLRMSSYEGTETSGEVNTVLGLKESFWLWT